MAAVDPRTVLAVVPTLNEEAHIAACLESLIANDPNMAAVRIVVADGGSNDKTREIVRDLQKRWSNVHLIDNPHRLQAAAINLAVRECATTEHAFLVRCDAHSRYPPGFVLGVVEGLAERGAASLAVPMDAKGDGCFQRATALITDTPLGSGGSAHRGGLHSSWVDHGHHAGFDLLWFRRLGGYDETFSHNEDAEYDRRLTEAGGRIWLDAELRIGVAPRATPTALARQYWQYGKGRARTVLKHRMRPRLRQIIPVIHVLALAFSLPLMPFHTLSMFYLVTYVTLLLGASFWGILRLKSVCGAWVGIALACIHTAWGSGFLYQTAFGRRRPNTATTFGEAGF